MTHHQKSSSSQFRWDGKQRRIGITGGIATGKSSVAHYLQNVQALPVLDADVLARNLLTKGSKTTLAVIHRYGKTVVVDGCENNDVLDRSALSHIIFSDPQERRWLEELIHPQVFQLIVQELTNLRKEPIVVLLIPLLFEAKYTEMCSEIWVVSCNPDQQIRRLIDREGFTVADANARISAQLPLDVKISFADVVIDNSGDHFSWISQVKGLL